MKNILILTFALAFSALGFSQYDHFNVQIGTVSGTAATLTMPPAQVFSKVAAHVATNFTVTYTQYSIVQRTGNHYNLILRNQAGTISTAIELILDDGKLYEARTAGGGISVTCSPCSVGCHPDAYEGHTFCTACFNEQDCDKSESSTSAGTSIL